MIKSLFIVIVGAFIAGCSALSPFPEVNKIKGAEYKNAKISKPSNYKEVQNAFKTSKLTHESYSRWYDRKEKLELTIVGPVYKNPSEKESEAYTKLNSFLKKLSPELLEKLGENELASRYSKINYVPYKLGSKEDTKFEAVYANKLESKDKISDILQNINSQGVDTPEQSLAIWINPKDLKNNIYTLEGYKAVKTTTKKRNSYYYQLSKQNSKGVEDENILNAVLAILKLSIPEYVSIDRKDMLKNGETFRIITDNDEGGTTGEVYKLEADRDISELKRLKIKTKDVEKLAEIDKEIKAVKESKKWREYETKQLIYTSAVSQNTINTLFRHKYISQAYSHNTLDITQAKEVGEPIHMSLVDPFLMIAFEHYRVVLNELGINVGTIKSIGKAYYLLGENKNTKYKDKKVSGDDSWKVFFLPGFKQAIIDASKEDGKVEELTQKGVFYGMSTLTDENAYKKVHKNEYVSFGVESKHITSTKNDIIGLGVGSNLISYYLQESKEIKVCDSRKGFECISYPIGNSLRGKDNILTALSSDESKVIIYADKLNSDSIIQVLSLDSGKIIHQKQQMTNQGSFLIVSDDGRYFAISGNEQIELYDAKTYRLLHTFKGSTTPPVFSDKGNIIAIGGLSLISPNMIIEGSRKDFKLDIYSTDQYNLINSYEVPNAYRRIVDNMAITVTSAFTLPFYMLEDEKVLYFGIGASRCVKWNYETGVSEQSDQIPGQPMYGAIAFTIPGPNKKYHLINHVSTSNGRFYIYDRDSKQFDLSYFYEGMGVPIFMKNGRYIVLENKTFRTSTELVSTAIKVYDTAILDVAKGEF
ncbi:hypothetical protein N9A28_07340 [Sulfurimonas sp.]|nr:hypothetical protein [Sulfurimonas sp.]